MSEIAVYIPVRNDVSWCQEVPLLSGLKYVASDNASTLTPVGTVSVKLDALALRLLELLASVTAAFHRNSSLFCENAMMCAEPSVLNEPMRRNFVSLIPLGRLAHAE